MHFTKYHESTSHKVSRSYDLHKEIGKRIEQNNVNYKLRVDLKRRFKEFKVDYVIVQIRPERFPTRIVKKLYARSAGPFKILKKINDNAFLLDLPEGFNFSSTFNIEGLVEYKGLDLNPDNPLVDGLTPESILKGPSLPPLLEIQSTAAHDI